MELENGDKSAAGVRKANAAGASGAKKKKRRRILIAALAVAAAAIAIPALVRSGKSRGVSIAYTDTTVLECADFENSISATGTVESNDSHFVYSTQSYVVTDVYAEVGDRVDADTLLCSLDTDALEEQIEARELSLGISAESAAQTVKTARDSYNAAAAAVKNDENSSLVSAESGVRTAYESWQRAVKTYNDYAATLDSGLNSALLSQDAAVNSAGNALESAESAYSSAKSALSASSSALDSFEKTSLGAVGDAGTALNNAKLLEAARQKELETALAEYASALSAYQAATAARTTAESARDAAKAASDADPGNAELISALADAETALTAAAAAENDNKTALTASEGAVSTAEAALNAAKAVTNSSEGALGDYQALQADYNAKKAALESARDALDAANSSYELALKTRRAAYKSADSTLSDYSIAVDTAYSAYQSALNAYDATEASVDAQLQSSYNSLKSSELGTNQDSAILELANLQKDLEDTSIYAGCAGTVTAVYASVGSSGAGLLFVIEDVDDLVVETSVKEYDVDTVEEGMEVTIKSEGTGSEVYKGKVSTIAPTTNKNAAGTTDQTGDIEFAVKVKVTSPDTRLRIGMSVRLNYIIERQSNVLAAPYETVYKNAAGEDAVLAITEDGEGRLILKELPVTLGFENDLDIVISGDGIEEGIRLVNDPESYADYIGSVAELVESTGTAVFPFNMQ